MATFLWKNCHPAWGTGNRCIRLKCMKCHFIFLAIKSELEESKTEEPRDPITAVISHTIPEDADADTKERYFISALRS